MKTETHMAEVLFDYFNPSNLPNSTTNQILQKDSKIGYYNVQCMMFPETLPEARINADFGTIIVLVESLN